MYFNSRTHTIKRISTVGNIVLVTALAKNCDQNRLHKNTDSIQEIYLKKLKSKLFDQGEKVKIDYLTYMQLYYHCRFSSLRAIFFLILLLGMSESEQLIFSFSVVEGFSVILQDFLFPRLHISGKQLYHVSDLPSEQENTFFFKCSRLFELWGVSRPGYQGKMVKGDLNWITLQGRPLFRTPHRKTLQDKITLHLQYHKPATKKILPLQLKDQQEEIHAPEHLCLIMRREEKQPLSNKSHLVTRSVACKT